MTSASAKLTTVVSTEGLVFLPKSIRDRRRWTPGTRLTVEEAAEGVMLRAAAPFTPTSIDAVFGSLAYHGATLSVEQMEAAVAVEAERRVRT